MVFIGHELTFDQPHPYEIRVGGVIDDCWSGRLGGMSIHTESTNAQTRITVLVGEIQDEAALNGVLTTLYRLGLPLLSVRPIQAEQNLSIVSGVAQPSDELPEANAHGFVVWVTVDEPFNEGREVVDDGPCG